MFISFWKKINHSLQLNKFWKRAVAYGIVVFLVMQCYILPIATETSEYTEENATIGDATWTTAVPETNPDTGESDSWQENNISVYNAVSDLYRIEPDMNQPFVAYAMTIPKGSGMNQANLCATYVSQALYGYYGNKAPVSGSTRVIQISSKLEATGNWKCVYKNASCFSSAKTDEEYDRLFDSLTNSGDIVCFVNQSESDQVHCAIAGGGASLVGHLTSSGWDSLRASYYLASAVDRRKICTGMIVYRYKEPVRYGTIRVCKSYDEDLYRTNPEVFDIGGADYGVYATKADAQSMKNAKGYCYVEPGDNGALAEDNVSKNARSKLKGEGETVQLPEGTYYIREVRVPLKGGWQLDPGIYETKIYAGKRTLLGLPRDKFANNLKLDTSDYRDSKVIGPEKPYLGYVSLKKEVEESYKNTIYQNPNYDYSGIEYTVYRVSGDKQYNTSRACGIFRADKQGKTTVVDCKYNPNSIGTAKMGLPVGWYMIQETKTNSSMELDTTAKWVQIVVGETAVKEIVMRDPPELAKPGLLLRKYGEDESAVAQAKYRISFFSECMDRNPAENGKKAQRTWIFRTDAQGELHFANDARWFVEGDSFYLDKQGNVKLPAGTITIQEIEAPSGYVLDPTIYVKKITPGDTLHVLSVEQVITVTEKTIRGDLEFQKVDSQGRPLANIKFSITDSYGESQIVWTDENGYYSTAASYISHKKETNTGEPNTGVWFGQTEVDDAAGALPFGVYVIKELRCEANRNTYRSIDPVTVEITEHAAVVSLKTIVNDAFPDITTKAQMEELAEDISQQESILCMDHVILSNVEIGHTYVISGRPYRKDTGDVLEPELWTCEEQVVEATDTQVEVDIPYKILLSEGLYDKELVFFEYVTDEQYPDEIVAKHEDIDDKDQTVYIPPLPTTEEPTTEEPTTEAPTTEVPTTEAPTTEEPTTEKLTTEEITTEVVAGTSTENINPPRQEKREVRTGDETNLFILVLLISTSAVGIGMFLIGIYKKKYKR